MLLVQVMGRHDRLHQQLGHLQREMGGPGNPNPPPQLEMHFNMFFKKKLAAEVLILVRKMLLQLLLMLLLFHVESGRLSSASNFMGSLVRQWRRCCFCRCRRVACRRHRPHVVRLGLTFTCYSCQVCAILFLSFLFNRVTNRGFRRRNTSPVVSYRAILESNILVLSKAPRGHALSRLLKICSCPWRLGHVPHSPFVFVGL